MYLFEMKNQEIVSILSTLVGIAEKKSAHPILSNVWISKEGSQLKFTTTDLEIQLNAWLPSPQGSYDFSCTVAIRKILDILRSFENSVTPGFMMEESRLALIVERSRYLLQTMPTNLFPFMEEDPNYTIHFKISQAALCHHLSLVCFAMAPQDFRPSLSGVLLEITDDIIRFVATDVHRLAVTECTLDITDAGRGKFIIPRKAVIELIRVLSISDEPVEISLSSSQAKFSFRNITLISKIVATEYPDYRSAINNRNAEVAFSCSRLDLLKILQRASMLSELKLRGVHFSAASDLLKVTAQNVEKEEAYEELLIPYNGPQLEASYNASYIIDVLQAIDTTHVHLSFSTNNHSIRIIGENTHRYQYYVMPLRS